MKKYNEFIFESFFIDKKNNKIIFNYSFDNKIFFHPEIEIDLGKVNDISVIESAVFNLGMSEIPSFYKAFVPKKIIIKCGYLDKKQILFWKNLYTKGLGEFFHKNKINFKNLIKIESHSKKKFKKNKIKGGKVLLPIGGGKDSIVSAEKLKENGFDFTWFALEPNQATEKVIKISGNNKKIFLRRKIKKNFSSLIKLNQEEAYNGHVPISSVYAFSAVLVAQIYGFKYIALSNERSANIENTKFLGMSINHQYSKSFEFEKRIHGYIKENISKEIYYFSLLRNLYDIQILEKFSKYKKYFSVFLSCNPGLKDNKWCGECPKCAFTFLGLNAFLNTSDVEKIFGKNLFKDKNLLNLFKELTGKRKIKPMDCVGTVEESALGLILSKEKYKRLPFVLEKINFSKSFFEKNKKILKSNTKNHIIPKKFLEKKIALVGWGIENQALAKYFLEDRNVEWHIFDENIKKRKNKKIFFYNNLNIPKNFQEIYKTPGIPISKIILENKKIEIFSSTDLFLKKHREKIIGITGTKGKSTTASLINKILNDNGFKSVIVGNFGNPAIKYMNDKKYDFFVYEMSSYQCEFLKQSPKISAITNIFPDHLDYHGSFLKYKKAKINVTKFQTKNDYFFNMSNYEIDTKAKIFKLKNKKFKKFETQLLGEYNQKNCFLAFTITKKIGIRESGILKSIKNFKPLSKRLEKVFDNKKNIFYDDSLATIPEATLGSIKALGEVDTIILGGFDRKISLEKFAKEISKTRIKNFIIFPGNGKKMVKYIDKKKIFPAKNMKDAIEKVFSLSDGVCLLSNASPSFNLFRDYKDKSEQYKKWIKFFSKKF